MMESLLLLVMATDKTCPSTDHYKSTMYDRQDLSYTGVSQGWNAKGSFFISFIKISGFWR